MLKFKTELFPFYFLFILDNQLMLSPYSQKSRLPRHRSHFITLNTFLQKVSKPIDKLDLINYVYNIETTNNEIKNGEETNKQ